MSDENYRPIRIVCNGELRDINPTGDEMEFMELIDSWCKNERLEFARRSDNYISALCGMNDFLRFKLADKTKWFSICLPPDLRKEYISSPLFAQQEPKDRAHWKIKFKTVDDLEPYKDIISKSCIYME